MSENPQTKQITVRVIRDGSPEAPDNYWSKVSPEERIEAVWTLTKLCVAWNKPSTDVPRLQRTVTRVGPDRLETSFGGVPAFVISRHHLIANKKTAGRLQDLADVQQLEAIEDSF